MENAGGRKEELERNMNWVENLGTSLFNKTIKGLNVTRENLHEETKRSRIEKQGNKGHIKMNRKIQGRFFDFQ